MDASLKELIWKQFGASIDMLENAIAFCPKELWDTDTQFWYNAYHCLFFLDYYLTLKPETFAPPQPFTLSEFEDTLPDRIYSKEELLDYVQFCRAKCIDCIAGLTRESLENKWINESKSMQYPVIEFLLYNMRHVQHHAAQLNLLLRQGCNDAPEWVFGSKKNNIAAK